MSELKRTIVAKERLMTKSEAIAALSPLLDKFDIGACDFGKQRAACFGIVRRNSTDLKWLDLSKQFRSMLDNVVVDRGKEADQRKRAIDARAAHVDRLCRAVVKKDPMILLIGQGYLIGTHSFVSI